MRPNPRHVKRLVNVYRLVRSLARSQKDAVVLERPGATLRWLVMWAQWPFASMLMMRRYDAIEAGAESAPRPATDDPLLGLLDEVQDAAAAAVRPRLDDDLAVLRTLLELPNYAFAWEQLRVVRRYTVNFNPAVEAAFSNGDAPSPGDRSG